MRDIVILGSTGSIGVQALEVIAANPTKFRVVGLSAGSNNLERLIEQVKKFSVPIVGTTGDGLTLRQALPGVEVIDGPDSSRQIAALSCDVVLNGITGSIGLGPTLAALEVGNKVALANKESLVAGGDLVMAHGRDRIIPVDSEHSALFQAMFAGKSNDVEKLILTASGGPFRQLSADLLGKVTPEQAVKHPNWSMGAKISVDSASLMNKGLELIEAYHLFPVTVDQLDVIVHAQSVIHSMVEYQDGSVLAQLGSPDMRTPISYCLAWPERMSAPVERLDLAKIAQLSFEEPDLVRFPCLRLAKDALAQGRGAPAILNAANEIAVAAFLDKRIGFMDIPSVVQSVLAGYDAPVPATIADILALDSEARRRAAQQVEAVAA